MNLKTDIERIFADNTNYANPGQAVNQASSLDNLSGDLYTDLKRFIYELLQNADDSSQNNKTIKVWIKTFVEYLVIAHSGRPFSARDLQGNLQCKQWFEKIRSNKNSINVIQNRR